MDLPRFIGIDVGVSSMCVSTSGPGGRPEIIANRDGETIVPAVVSFSPDAAPLVGTAARRQATQDPRGTISGILRLLGRRYDDRAVAWLREASPYPVVPGPNGDAWVEVHGRPTSPEEVTAHLLRALRQTAEDHFGGAAVPGAVLTVPASFDHAQRQAIKDAAEIAGLPVRRLLHAQTAAALGAGAHLYPAARVAVCDVGGGSVDVSIIAAEEGALEVLANAGDGLLGGDDLDRLVLSRLAAEIRASTGTDVEADPTALALLREVAQTARHALSEATSAALQVPQLLGSDRPYARTVERTELETWVKDIVARLDEPCRAALAAARLEPKNIDQLVLVGGTSRMPLVQRRLIELFGRPPHKTANPVEVVALGAARHCALLAGLLQGVALLDVTPRAIGLRATGGAFIPVILQNTTMPARDSKLVATARDGQRELVIEACEAGPADGASVRPLSRLVVSGLPEAPAGEVMVIVDFTVDVDGLLHLSARELASGARAETRVQRSTGLSRADVRRLAVDQGQR